MPFDRFMIAPINEGLHTDQKPWLIPDDAFAKMDNAYVFRSRVRKRFGSQLMGSGWSSAATAPLFSRLRVQVGTIGAPASPVPTATGAIGQLFSAGDQIFTVVIANGAMLATGVGTGTFNTATGVFALAGTGLAGATPIWWYPALPVMGLTNYEIGAINDQPSYAFDTRFAYVFGGGFWQRSFTANTPIFHGSNSDFFWTTNWHGIAADPNQTALFVTNYHVTNYNGAVDAVNDDPIWTFSAANGWATFTPKFLVAGAGNFIKTARLIIVFKDRLLLLNTVETDAANANNITYPQRLRYSHNGIPSAANAFLEPNQVGADGGGFLDASTEEQIISAEFIKDRLIVYFERSTWELVYTGNQVLPFVWQKINTELGSEAMLSSVPFDKVVLTVGTSGINACNGANVERVDNSIPDQVFQIRQSGDGIDRVAGIRDYFTEMVYWTFPIDDAPSVSSTFPTKVLVYNYKNGAWAFNDDCITVWGYFEQQTGKTWANSLESWNTAAFAWNSGSVQANFRQVIAGNQQGFVFIIDPDEPRNAPVMQITNMVGNLLTIIDHSLNVGDYIAIENALGSTNLNGDIVQVTTLPSKDTVTIFPISTGLYTGQGTASRVSKINILSKQWNPYVDKDRNLYLSKIDFLVDNEGGVSAGVTVDFLPSSTELSMTALGAATGALLGTNFLSTSPYALSNQEGYQERLWHPIYFQAEGNGIQINITMTDEQMKNPDVSWEDFQLHALTLYTIQTSFRLE